MAREERKRKRDMKRWIAVHENLVSEQRQTSKDRQNFEGTVDGDGRKKNGVEPKKERKKEGKKRKIIFIQDDKCLVFE